MVDLSDKRSDEENMNDKIPEDEKRCADCGTSKTPLWRGGPAGPKSLCNACGIRSRKKRGGANLGIKSESVKKTKKTLSQNININININNKSTSSNSSSGSSGISNSNSTTSSKLGGSGRNNDSTLNQRLVALGREVMMRSTVGNKPRRRTLGEEEQAAVLLMALSYGSVFA